ncbi:hypothetical protein BKA81DRAFT_13752 [Phyllosticta paracitricarpa]
MKQALWRSPKLLVGKLLVGTLLEALGRHFRPIPQETLSEELIPSSPAASQTSSLAKYRHTAQMAIVRQGEVRWYKDASFLPSLLPSTHLL